MNNYNESLEIIGPIHDYVKKFNSIEEFNLFYDKNKVKIDALSTNKLNKLYYINGYRITKIGTRDENGKKQQGKICLKKSENNEVNVNPIENIQKRLTLIEHDLNECISKINILTESYNQIISN